MCRALLESALKERFDPFHKIENRLPKGHSLFKKLIEVAKLDDPLPERAERIKECGDWAAHSDSRFEKECESRSGVEDNLDWTRTILAALYPKDGNYGI